MNTVHKYNKLTLEDVLNEIDAKKKEIAQQHDIVVTKAKNIFSPFGSTANKTHSIVRSLGSGIAIMDGLLLSLKAFKGFKIFKKLFEKKPHQQQ